MTLNDIHEKIDHLIIMIRQNPEDQDCIFNCEMELAYLEELREELEKED